MWLIGGLHSLWWLNLSLQFTNIQWRYPDLFWYSFPFPLFPFSLKGKSMILLGHKPPRLLRWARLYKYLCKCSAHHYYSKPTVTSTLEIGNPCLECFSCLFREIMLLIVFQKHENYTISLQTRKIYKMKSLKCT